MKPGESYIPISALYKIMCHVHRHTVYYFVFKKYTLIPLDSPSLQQNFGAVIIHLILNRSYKTCH